MGAEVLHYSGCNGFLSTRVGFVEEEHSSGFGVPEFAVFQHVETIMRRLLPQELSQVPG